MRPRYHTPRPRLGVRRWPKLSIRKFVLLFEHPASHAHCFSTHLRNYAAAISDLRRAAPDHRREPNWSLLIPRFIFQPDLVLLQDAKGTLRFKAACLQLAHAKADGSPSNQQENAADNGECRSPCTRAATQSHCHECHDPHTKEEQRQQSEDGSHGNRRKRRTGSVSLLFHLRAQYFNARRGKLLQFVLKLIKHLRNRFFSPIVI